MAVNCWQNGRCLIEGNRCALGNCDPKQRQRNIGQRIAQPTTERVIDGITVPEGRPRHATRPGVVIEAPESEPTPFAKSVGYFESRTRGSRRLP
jgi:hypothetical protein